MKQKTLSEIVNENLYDVDNLPNQYPYLRVTQQAEYVQDPNTGIFHKSKPSIASFSSMFSQQSGQIQVAKQMQSDIADRMKIE